MSGLHPRKHRLFVICVFNWLSYYTSSVSSVHFDLIAQEMMHLRYTGGFHAGPGPISGDGDDIITELASYHM